jgi:hypothetical protein
MGARPVLDAVQEQQHVIEGLRRTVAKQGLVIDYIARIAGLTSQVTAIHKAADVNNPGQPIPDPPSEGPEETTEQAATPEAMDSPLVPGQTPGSVQRLPAETTATPMDPGTTLPTAPYNDLVNVQAPIAGTEEHVPYDQTRTEVDVRVGDPMNPQRAFPWGLGPDAQGQQGGQGSQRAASRSMASLRLARLRLQAGTAEGDDLRVAASIEADGSITDEAIDSEISTLAGVVKAAAKRTQRPAAAVPRSASSVQRTTPSLVGGQGPGLSAEASHGSVDEDMENADLFL